MSLIGTLNVGRSGLASTQAAIQTTANNIANAGNADYTRQLAKLAPRRDQQIRTGLFVGTGVDVASIQRQIDQALEARIRAAVSDNASADVTQQWLGRVEAVFNELGDDDLSTRLSQFFAAWSNLANNPQDLGLRQIVLQEGQSVAQWVVGLRSQFSGLAQDVDQRTEALTAEVDLLAEKVARLNRDIAASEGGGGVANGLRDQRDAVLKQLAGLVPIRTVEQPGGMVDVQINSEPLVIGGASRGAMIKREAVEGSLDVYPAFKFTGGAMILDGKGQLGALGQVKKEIRSAIDQLDALAAALIFQVNRLHSSGQGLEGFSSVSAEHAVTDPAAALNHSDADLPFPPTHGSFVVHVKNKLDGTVSSTLINVDLDGIGPDQTLTTLAAQIDAVDGINASVTAGRLTINVDNSARQFTFSQDSSGVLAALGIGGFFAGSDARDMAVAQSVLERPARLSAAANGQPGDNQTARAIADLERIVLESLGGVSIKDGYERLVNHIAMRAGASKNAAESASLVLDTLQTQREALSGVSLDEEAMNLMKYQRAYQGAARVIAAVDEMMETILRLV